MIRNILLRHAGRYGCRAQTSADTVTAEAELLVRGDAFVRLCNCELHLQVLIISPHCLLELMYYC